MPRWIPLLIAVLLAAAAAVLFLGRSDPPGAEATAPQPPSVPTVLPPDGPAAVAPASLDSSGPSDESPSSGRGGDPPDEPAGAIRGRVVLADDDVPVAGCVVHLVTADGEDVDRRTTNLGGGFLFAPVAPDYYQLTFEHQDSRLYSRPAPIHVTAGVLDLGSIPAWRGILVSGRVVDVETGDPVGSAEVVGFQPNAPGAADGGRQTTLSRSDGRFQFEQPLLPGELIVSATAERHTSRSPHVRLDLGRDDHYEVTVRAYRTFPLLGVVRSPAGDGVAATVEVIGGARRACCFDTEADGRFYIEDILGELELGRAHDAIRLMVRARASGFRDGMAESSVGSVRDGLTVDVRVEDGGAVRGRCVDPGGRPLSGVLVRVYPDRGDRLQAVRETETGDDGAFRVAGLDAGPMRIEPSAAFGRVATPRSALVTVTGVSEVGGIDFKFDRGLPIAGEAVDTYEGLRPLADRLVTLHHSEWLYPLETLTDHRGRFRFDGVPAGRYDVALRGNSWEDLRPPVVVSEVAAGTETVRIEVTEEPEDGVVVLRVSDAQSGRPITREVRCGLRYLRFARLRTDDLSLTPDEDGVLIVTDLPLTDIEVEVSTTDYASTRLTLTPTEAAPEARGDVFLRRGVPLFGHVTDATGRPIEGATVRAFETLHQGALSPSSGVATDAFGGFTISHASPAAEWIAASAPGYAARAYAIVPGSIGSPQNLALSPGATLDGRIEYADGTAASAVVLKLVGDITTRYTVSDFEGAFRFDDVEDGPFDVFLLDDEQLGSGEIVDAQPLSIVLEL